MVRMTDTLFYFLFTIIPTRYISVQNSPTESIYSFEYIDENGDLTVFELYSLYSHTDQKNSYVRYELYVDEELVATATRAVFDKKAAKPTSRTRRVTLAEKLETLITMCSQKVIQQEFESHTRHMLKSFVNTSNQKVN